MDDFAQRLAAPTPTPGGGAAAARVGVYACSLLRMVTGITVEKARSGKSPGNFDPAALLALETIQDEARLLSERFQALEIEDMAAFQSYLDALRLPRGSEEEKAQRLQARRQAAWRATEAPLSIMNGAYQVLLLAERLLALARTTPLKAESDLGAALELAQATFRVAELNVRVNLPELAESAQSEATRKWQTLAVAADGLYNKLRPAFTGTAP